MAQVKALIFDQDGVIIDTERDGHRVAFNQAFQEFGYNVEWGVETYHGLLQVAGGKERMKHYLHTEGFGKPVKPEAGRAAPTNAASAAAPAPASADATSAPAAEEKSEEPPAGKRKVRAVGPNVYPVR